MLSSSLRRVGAKRPDVPLAHVRHATTALLKRSKGHSKDDINRIKTTSNQLIDGAKQAQNPEWRHTYDKKGETKRLERDLLANKDAMLRGGIDITDISTGNTLEEWTTEDGVPAEANNLQPGTYFEIRRNAVWDNGVVLATAVKNVGYNEDTQSINCRGQIFFHRSTDVMFAVPNLVDALLVKRCGQAEVHEDQHQLAARLRVIKAARKFEREVEKEQYRLGRAIRDIYPQVRARDPDEWGKVTTMQVARMLDATPNVPMVTLLAVHRQLMDRADEFCCHPSRHRFVHTFDVRPLSHLRNIEAVKQMVRDDSPVIRSFQKKAMALIDRSRELAAKSIGESPTQIEVPDQHFTAQEQEIITFLKLSLSTGRRIQQDSYEGIIPTIIKDTFRYDELITAYVALKFLREIGVFTPWEDMASKEKDLYIPESYLHIPESSEPLVRPVQNSTSGKKATNPPGLPTLNPLALHSTVGGTAMKTPGLLTVDPHESMRHDFGDMPVYVIDDATAEELDDGISIEAVPGEPGSAWIHVHVADPTAVVPITHPLAQVIQKRTETYYFEHQTVPMLPQDIGSLCDMGRANVHEVGQNVLSFSAKIGPDAEILDYKVRAGRVRNVHKLKYDDVNRVLMSRAPAALFTPFEPDLASSEKHDISYVLPHANDLKHAFEVTRRMVAQRLAANTFVFSMNSAQVAFLDKPVLQSPSHVVRPILHRGYPRLRYYVMQGDSAEIGSRSLVAECMKIAGRVASRFCLDHNIPAIRRAMSPVGLSDAALSRILAARNEFGLIEFHVLAKEGIMLPTGELTTLPLGHWMLGIPVGEGYVRSTSPLRRAEDMIMHWQIKSALLPGGGASPPIDDVGMYRLLEDLNGRKHILKKAYRAHNRQWAHTYIQRFMEEQEKAGTATSESNPLRNMDAHVVQLAVYNIVRWSMYQDVYIPKLGMTAVLPVKPSEELPVGSQIKVNAHSVFQYDLNHTLEVELA